MKLLILAFKSHNRIFLILALAFLIRIIPACLFFGSYDSIIASDTYFSALKTSNFDYLYIAHAGLQHFPGWIWLLWLIGIFAELMRIPYHVFFKFPAIFSDLAISILIYKTFLNLGSTREVSSNKALLFALNPISILISSVNGQFDSLTIFLCLTAWYLWRFNKRFKIASAVFLGIGVIIKEYPAVLFAAFWCKMRKLNDRVNYLGYFLLPIIVALVIAYFTTTLRFLGFLFKYGSTRGFWGPSLIAKYMAHNLGNNFFTGLEFFVDNYMRYIAMAMMVFVWFLCFNKRKDALGSILLILTTLYFVAPGMAVQYLVWIVPFAVIKEDEMLKYYTIFVSIVVGLWFAPVLVTGNPMTTYNSIKWLNFTRNLFSVLGWAVTGLWSIRLIKVHLEGVCSET